MLSAISIIDRSLTSFPDENAFLRSRALGQSDGTWRYRGTTPNVTEFFDFSIRLRVDLGTEPDLTPIGEFLLDSDFEIADDERADVFGAVTMDIPGVGFVLAVSPGSRMTMFFAPPGVVIDPVIDPSTGLPDPFSGVIRNVPIRSGDEVEVTMDSSSDLLLRRVVSDNELFPENELFRLRSTVVGTFSILNSRREGPFRR